MQTDCIMSLSPTPDTTSLQITEWYSRNELHSVADSETEGENIVQSSLYIYLFGKKTDGSSVSVILKDFPCFFYLRIPHTWFPGKQRTRSQKDRALVTLLMDRLSSQDRDAFLSVDLCWRRVFRGFTNGQKFPFLRINFRNSNAMRNCAKQFIYENTVSGSILEFNSHHGMTRIRSDSVRGIKEGCMLQFIRGDGILYEVVRVEGLEVHLKGEVVLDQPLRSRWVLTKGDGTTKIRKPIKNRVLRSMFPGLFRYIKTDREYENAELYESNIDPMLRFMHIKKIEPCSWVSIPTTCIEHTDISQTLTLDDDDHEFNTMSQYEATLHWKEIEPISPETSKAIQTLAYDIECTSSHGDFPMAIKNYTKLAKDLLSLKRAKATTSYISTALRTLYQRDHGDLHRVYPKSNTQWSNVVESTETCSQLVKEIIQYLWLNWAATQVRTKGYFKVTRAVLMEALGGSTCSTGITEIAESAESEESEEELQEWLDTLCDDIPTLCIRRKQGFCKLGSTVDYEVLYTDRRDPKCYTTICLTAILDAHLPSLEGDRCIQIGACFHHQGDVDSYRKVMFALDTCDTFAEDVEVFAYPSHDDGERELLLAFREAILREDPDIITGYNTFNFDWPYLFDRAEELGIKEDFSQISRLQGYICKMEETKSKGARGKYVGIPGRVNLDLFKIVQRDYNLGSYKLDNVSAHFIRGKLRSIEALPNGTTRINTDNTIGVKPGNYVQFIESKAYDEDKLADGHKFPVLETAEEFMIVEGSLTIPSSDNSCNWALGKDDVTPQDIFDCQRGTSADRAKVAKYCIMDVVLCIELMNKLQILTNNVGMANVCTTPLSWIITRGQGIKILSLVSKQCRLQGYLLPTLFPDTYGDDSYEGAIVLKPYPGIYLDDAPVSILDYASLYPNSMRAENLSHETLVTDAKWLGPSGKERLAKLGYECSDITYDNYVGAKDKKVKTGECTVRFVQPRQVTKGKPCGKPGILPTILSSVISARKRTRKQILYKAFTLRDGTIHIGLPTGNEDEHQTVLDVDTNETTTFPIADIVDKQDHYSAFEKAVLDGRQLALKVTANSLYGQLGARTSPIYWKDIAAATTATGREQLYIAKHFIEKHYEGSKIVYGDTDSVFVKFRMLDEDGQPLRGKAALAESIRLGKEAGVRISKTLKHPQDLEYEKTFMPFILLSKKRYVGEKYEEDVNKGKQTSMGIVLKRRDNAPILKLIYGGVINIIMEQMKIVPAIDYLQRSLREFVTGRYGMEKLIITKTLNDGYKNPEMIAHKVLADRIAERDPGNKPQVYDRIPYVYIQTPDNVKLQGDRIESPEYIRAHRLKPDYNFYVTNQIMKPISQIFALCVTEIPTYRQHKDHYQRMAESHKLSGFSKEVSERKILLQKQKDASELLFWDIQIICDNQKSGSQSIQKWFK